MGNLEKDGLGLLRQQDRTTGFLKKLPCSLQDNVLQVYGIRNLTALPKNFSQQRAPMELLSTELFNEILKMSPRKGNCRGFILLMRIGNLTFILNNVYAF